MKWSLGLVVHESNNVHSPLIPKYEPNNVHSPLIPKYEPNNESSNVQVKRKSGVSYHNGMAVHVKRKNAISFAEKSAEWKLAEVEALLEVYKVHREKFRT